MPPIRRNSPSKQAIAVDMTILKFADGPCHQQVGGCGVQKEAQPVPLSLQGALPQACYITMLQETELAARDEKGQTVATIPDLAKTASWSREKLRSENAALASLVAICRANGCLRL